MPKTSSIVLTIAWLNVPSAIRAPTIHAITMRMPIASADPSTNHVINVINAPATIALTKPVHAPYAVRWSASRATASAAPAGRMP